MVRILPRDLDLWHEHEDPFRPVNKRERAGHNRKPGMAKWEKRHQHGRRRRRNRQRSAWWR